MNRWIGTGRLTKDPDLRKTQKDKSVCTYTMAVDRRFKSDNQPTADFINCVAWGNTADFVNKYFNKGKMILTEGTLQIRSWEDNDGNKHYSTEIIVDNVEFCGDKNESSSSNKNTKDDSNCNSKVKDTTKEDEEDPNDMPF